MLPKELQLLIDRYCSGKEPTQVQMDEIVELMIKLDADSEEADLYMQQRMQGPAEEEHPLTESEGLDDSVIYQVLLEDPGKASLTMVKTLMDITKKSLNDCRQLMISTPSVIIETEDKDEADRIQNLILSIKGQAIIVKKNILDSNAPENCEYQFSQYGTWNVKDLMDKASKMVVNILKGDAQSAFRTVAFLEYVGNRVMTGKGEHQEDLDEYLYLYRVTNAAVLLHFMPEKAAESLAELKELLVDPNTPIDYKCGAAYLMFEAYGLGIGLEHDPKMAANYAGIAFECAPNDTSALLARAYCKLKGWDTGKANYKMAKELATKALDLIRSEADFQFDDKYSEGLYRELVYSLDINDKESLPIVNENIDTPEKIVEAIIDNMVGGFENVHICKESDKYKVCKFLVTQREWECIMGNNPSYEKSPNFPIVNITYAEAAEFVERCNKIARQKGIELMIPPEDWQWLGYQRKCAESFKHLDKDILRSAASLFGWSEANSEGHLHDVGQLQPTNGIYDAVGLVYEMANIKRFTRYHYGAFNEPIKLLFGGTSTEMFYVDKRYYNLGLRLICLE